MDRVLPIRVDEFVVKSIRSLARRLRASKKEVLARAVKTYARTIAQENGFDVFEKTWGAW